MTKTVRGSRVTYRATATDRAGNHAQTSVKVRVLPNYLAGVPYRHGAFRVHAGRAYTLIAVGPARRPVYYDAAVYPRRPTKPDNRFHRAGHHRWAIGVSLGRSMRTHRYWNIGLKIGDTMQVIKLRVR